MANASDVTHEDCTRAYRAGMIELALPAAIIDSTTAEVIAANAGGLAALGLSAADRLPAKLDGAMPAMAVLRDVSRLNPAKPVRKSLILWQHARVHLRNADLSIASEKRPSHILAVFRPESETEAPHDPALAGKPAAARNGALGIAANDDFRPAADEEDATEALHGIRNPLPATELAKLAHELQTPLTAIATAAEIMRDERLGAMGNAKYLGYASDIYASATHALSVITEMLAAGAKAGYPAANSEPLDISLLAATTVSALQPLADSKALDLVYDGQRDLLPLKVNPTAIRQILINLLANALKFTPQGGKIRVSAGYLEDGAQFLAVRDTGDGMDEEAMAYALTDSDLGEDVRPGGGRGIGLRLVRQLASKNAADFEIDSAPGRGTVVLITFAKD